MNIDSFKCDSVDRNCFGSDFLVVDIPEFKSTEELIDFLANAMRFPSYFGGNWNALSDCLRDLNWVSERFVVLIHQHLPKISESDLVIYLDVLSEAVDSWREGDEHSLTVVLSADAKQQIVDMIHLFPQ